jgi:hypothetical protein
MECKVEIKQPDPQYDVRLILSQQELDELVSIVGNISTTGDNTQICSKLYFALVPNIKIKHNYKTIYVEVKK